MQANNEQQRQHQNAQQQQVQQEAFQRAIAAQAAQMAQVHSNAQAQTQASSRGQNDFRCWFESGTWFAENRTSGLKNVLPPLSPNGQGYYAATQQLGHLRLYQKFLKSSFKGFEGLLNASVF